MKRKEISLVLILILITAVIAVTAEGSTWRGRELRAQWEKAWKWGPFRLQPRLVITNAGYDTNVYYGATAEPIKDYTITAGPALNVYFPVRKKLAFTAFVSPQYVYYHNTARERTWNYYGRADVNILFNKFFVRAGAGYSDARERWNTEIDIRPRRKEESVFGEVLWEMMNKTSLGVNYSRARYDYENLFFEQFNIRERLNHDEEYFDFLAYYELTSRVRLFIDYERGNFDFADPENLRDSKSDGVYAGFEFSPFGRVRGRVKLGYKSFDAIKAGWQDFKGLVGDTDVSVRLMRVLSVRGSYRRDVRFSLWYDNAYFLENRGAAGASVYFFKKIRLDYDYSVGRNTYPGGQLSSSSKREDVYIIHSAGLYFRLQENIGIGIVASRWNRDSNLDWEDDTRDFVGLNLTYDF
jgi:hypothetical protein